MLHIKVLIVTGGYYDYKGEASTEVFNYPTGTNSPHHYQKTIFVLP